MFFTNYYTVTSNQTQIQLLTALIVVIFQFEYTL